jgi:hypothetical protein
LKIVRGELRPNRDVQGGLFQKMKKKIRFYCFWS